MIDLDLNKKLQVFFWNFSRKDIERLYNISLDSLPQTIENELQTYPQKDFIFAEYIIDKEYQKKLDKFQRVDCDKIVKNMSHKQIVLTNYPAFISNLLCEVATNNRVDIKIKADDIVLYYRDSDNEFKYYAKREEMGETNKAYFVDEYGKKVILYNVCDCEIKPNF